MARRADGGNAGNGFQSMSSDRTDLKPAPFDRSVDTIDDLLIRSDSD
jgi:hypothetical protein